MTRRDSSRRQSDAARFAAQAERAKQTMLAAIEAYAQARISEALAFERLERARERQAQCTPAGQCPYHASGGPESIGCGLDAYSGVLR